MDSLTSSMGSFDLGAGGEVTPDAGAPPPQPAAATPRSVLAGISDDCILQVFRFLPPWPDLAMAALVCQKFYRVSLRPILWADLHLAGKRAPVNDQLLTSLCARSGAALQRLAVQSSEITATGLAAATSHCPRLVAVEICDGRSLAWPSLLELVARCPQLRQLSASGCARHRGDPGGGAALSGEMAESMLELCRLDDCEISDLALAGLLQICPHLQHLHV